MIQEYLIKKGLDIIYSYSEKVLKNTKISLKSNRNDLDESIFNHIKVVKNWSGEITFNDLKKSKNTRDVFIDLDLYFQPKRVRLTQDEELEKTTIDDLFKTEDKHIALLGQPGSGKTTTLKHLCQSVLYDENFCQDEFNIPILIKLNDFNGSLNSSELKKGILFNSIFGILGLKIESDKIDNEIIIRLKENIVIKVLENLKVLLVIDGFDELQYQNRRDKVIEEIKKLSSSLESSKLIITSRTADFHYNMEGLAVYEICPLNEEQIKSFANKWLKNEESSNSFLLAIRNSPFYDTTIRPLTIAHLCAIYERVGKIPDKPKTVYKKVINLLLEEWDEQMDIPVILTP